MDLETGKEFYKRVNTDQQTNQRENSISSSSSSSSDSSSDGQIDLGQIPHSKNLVLNPEPHCKKSSNLHSFAHSHPGSPSSSSSSSSSSPQKNQLIGTPGYDPNRIPSSIFAAKSTNPMEWSVASSESLCSLQSGKTSDSIEQGLATYKMDEIPKVDEPVHQKTDNNLVPPSVMELEKHEMVQNLKQKEKSESESEDEEEEEEEFVEIDKENKTNVVFQTEKQADNDDDDDDDGVKNNEAVESVIVCHSTSASCHSDTSSNSNGSFAFPM